MRNSAHFPLIAVTGYRSHAVRRVELTGYSSDTRYYFAYCTVRKKSYNIIVSHIVQL